MGMQMVSACGYARMLVCSVDAWPACGSERALRPSVVTWATPSSLRRNRNRDRTVLASAGPRACTSYVMLCYVRALGRIEAVVNAEGQEAPNPPRPRIWTQASTFCCWCL